MVRYQLKKKIILTLNRVLRMMMKILVLDHDPRRDIKGPIVMVRVIVTKMIVFLHNWEVVILEKIVGLKNVAMMIHVTRRILEQLCQVEKMKRETTTKVEQSSQIPVVYKLGWEEESPCLILRRTLTINYYELS